MTHVIKERRTILKGIDEKGLMIRAHGDDQVRGVQELRGHLALLVLGGIHPPLHHIGVYVWMHLLRDGHRPRGADPDRGSGIEPRLERVFRGHAAKDVACTHKQDGRHCVHHLVGREIHGTMTRATHTRARTAQEQGKARQPRLTIPRY
jgi:hypothetical protein